MHICRPSLSSSKKNDIPADLVAGRRESQSRTRDAKNANKPKFIIDKMVEGRLEKFYGEWCCFLEQPFVRDQTITVERPSVGRDG